MSIALKIEERIYKIAPDMNIVCAIEDELGGIPALARRLTSGNWRMAELVTLIHIMLQMAGKNMDFMTLGNVILKEGAMPYLASARQFLNMILPKEQS